MSDSQAQKVESVTILGIGLIGASFAHALRKADLATSICGFDLCAETVKRAKEIGVIDHIAPDLPTSIATSALIVIAAPVGAINDLCEAINQHAKPDTLIIDVGSVKEAVVDAANGLRDDLYFVPCHPISGTEQSGPDAGFAELFENRWSILTPLKRSDQAYEEAVKHAAAIWRAIGADVEIMDAKHHDLALAVTSHLPHLIAFTLVGAADDIETVAQSEIVKYSAGGFRDFTRIAASDPIMWRDVFLNNREAILEVLGRFSEELAVMQRAIRWGDGNALEEAFSRGRTLRKAIVDAGQETSHPNFGRDQK